MAWDSYFWLAAIIILAILYRRVYRKLLAPAREPRTFDRTECDRSREGDRADETEGP